MNSSVGSGDWLGAGRNWTPRVGFAMRAPAIGFVPPATNDKSEAHAQPARWRKTSRTPFAGRGSPLLIRNQASTKRLADPRVPSGPQQNLPGDLQPPSLHPNDSNPAPTEP